MPFSSGDPYTDPLSPVALTTLLTALGLSSTAGLRAYLPLLILGVASDIRGPDGMALLPVQDQFHILGNPLVLGVLAILVVLEFLADKIPGVDHISDIVHTIIRPAAGALIMAGSANTLSDESKIVAAVVGALVALVTHFMKAGTRAAVTSTTAGVGNPFASFLEDILVVGVILLLVLAPIVGFIALVLLLILFFKATKAMFRGVRRIFGGGGSRPAGAVNAPNAFSDTTMTYSPPSDDSLAPMGTTYGASGAPPTLPTVSGGYAVNAPYPPDADTIQQPN
ncbi:MAG TPA: DUF4126 domain-containing protein [Ktedonobacterales bacterium]|nr:DUF4126 domain-containing protein [Ktedonobacterales bacterium]